MPEQTYSRQLVQYQNAYATKSLTTVGDTQCL